MSKKTIYITFLTLMFGVSLNAQNSIDNILIEVGKNNKAIQSNKQYWEAQKVKYKSGLNPSNPKVEYEFLSGSPATAGNQTDIFIIQELDFPTAYIKKNQVANEQIGKIEFEEKRYKQKVLLVTKQLCIDLVYLNKKQAELDKRLELAEKLYIDFKSKFENGDANSIEVSKANLLLINLRNESRLNTSNINQNYQKLVELNGGNDIDYSDLNYPVSAELPDFKLLEEEIERNDPLLNSYKQDKEIVQRKIELNRAMTFPKLEGGYHSQKILGQSFQGVHIGITIPLWEGKNSVKHQKEQLTFTEFLIDDHSTEHYYEIKQLYDKVQSLKLTLKEYEGVLNSLSDNTLINKSFELGELSSIDYFMELNYFYDMFDDYLSLEKEYHIVVTNLYKFKL